MKPYLTTICLIALGACTAPGDFCDLYNRVSLPEDTARDFLNKDRGEFEDHVLNEETAAKC